MDGRKTYLLQQQDGIPYMHMKERKGYVVRWETEMDGYG
jgi:hypothetical protein